MDCVDDLWLILHRLLTGERHEPPILVLEVDAGVENADDLKARLRAGGRHRGNAVAETDANLVGELAADDKAVRVGGEGLETPFDHVMDDVGNTHFASSVDANAGHRVIASGMAQNNLADERRRCRDAVHGVQRIEDRRRTRDAADRIARQHAPDLDGAVGMERRQRLRRGLPNLVRNDNVRIGVDELRQKVAVKTVHHAADADEDRNPEHDPANRDGRLTLARAQMGEGDGEGQGRHGETPTA